MMHMNRASKRTSYRRQLMISYVLLAVAVLLIASTLLLILLSQLTRESEQQHLEQLLSVVNEDLSSRLTDVQSTGFDLVIDNDLREQLNLKTDIEISRAKIKVGSILKSKLISSQTLSSLVLLDAENHVYSTNVSLLLPEGFDWQSTDVYRNALKRSGNVVWLSHNDIFDAYLSEDVNYALGSDIHAAAVVIDYSHKQTLGMLMLSLKEDYFSSISYSSQLLSGSRLFLVSPDKQKVYTIGSHGAELSRAALERLTLAENTNETFTLGKDLYFAQYNDTMQWYLVTEAEMSLFQRSATTLMLGVLLAVGVALLLGALFSQLMARIATRGMGELIRGMEQVEQENLEVTIPVIRQDEFGRMAQAFNHMVMRLRELIRKEYKEKLLMQEAEFKALQAQIHPHFLYNTFDMLHWKLLERGQEDLADTVVSLGSLMRYTMTSGQWHVTLSQEILNIQKYIEVHQAIRGCHIQADITAEGMQEWILPRQTLQPLIENSFKYGFVGRDHGNRLSLTGSYINEEHTAYCLKLTDNGAGMSPEELEQLNSRLRKGEHEAAHLGLLNIQTRLRYLYPDASIQLDGEYGFWLTVTILMKKEAPYENSDH